MKKREPISHIMTQNVKSVGIKDTLKSVSELFDKSNFRHLPIVDGTKVKGIVSKTDLSKLDLLNLFDNQKGAREALLETLTLEQLVTFNPICAKATDSIQDVMEIFIEHHFHALPVVDENEHLLGIVTVTDVLKHFHQ
jgi:CBS domain-containing protein